MIWLIGVFIVLGLIVLVVVGIAIWQCVEFIKGLQDKL